MATLSIKSLLFVIFNEIIQAMRLLVYHFFAGAQPFDGLDHCLNVQRIPPPRLLILSFLPLISILIIWIIVYIQFAGILRYANVILL